MDLKIFEYGFDFAEVLAFVVLLKPLNLTQGQG